MLEEIRRGRQGEASGQRTGRPERSAEKADLPGSRKPRRSGSSYRFGAAPTQVWKDAGPGAAAIELAYGE